ncbi:hypothetical protein N7462_003365 [Penicillium macrosclerotiorum]|uniref:uncharacterized protein n=1 Tax=Penicillium macrosclerotiorum TaxID=303699 RepID=UPI0025466EB1|nr:uncharacterized protein N7462_003365 [Penicillium macrosclerotiorum]KAJ5688973.1 hypothetical protein N7462_003365 [Penicillium macrosclerotiorum]
MATSPGPQLLASGGAASPPATPAHHVHLDGRTLEGGGQLVRNALTLSVLTGRAVTINHVRGNRGGKTGLKASHAAAVKLLAEISRSIVSDGRVGSQCLTFSPPAVSDMPGGKPLDCSELAYTAGAVPLVSLSNLSVQSEYNIRLPTPGSVFLVFQALYPYLLHVGSRACTECIKVNITGGTNGTNSPSYDYASQVMVPNFIRLGLPPLSIRLQRRGWSTGEVKMGTVSFLIHPLAAGENVTKKTNGQTMSDEGRQSNTMVAPALGRFPSIDLMNYERGQVTRIEVTVLAPDVILAPESTTGETWTVRQYIERETSRRLRQAIKELEPSIFASHSAPYDTTMKQDLDIETENGVSHVPIRIHTSETTSSFSQQYLLIVAHTSSGFRIGHDLLLGEHKSQKPFKRKLGKHQKYKKGQGPPAKKVSTEANLSRVSDLIEDCVHGFVNELSGDLTTQTAPSPESPAGRRSCLDQYMRDQVVVFEALGYIPRSPLSPAVSEKNWNQEDRRHWTLHTQTAQWVCREMLAAEPKN